jgi:hypothetical protein
MLIMKELGSVPLRWDDGRVIHAVEGARSDYTVLLWTRCRRNLAAGAVMHCDLPITCPDCLQAGSP